MTERGFSLIEVLIALAVLSVGLLGASALLLDGIRRQDQALHQQAALWLITDVADLIRATPGSADAADFTAAAVELFPHQAPEATVTQVPTDAPAEPVRHRISLRWRDSRDSDEPATMAITLLTPPSTPPPAPPPATG